jgi:DNA invertase Pin-like site-specific DNA recombinase
VTSIDALKQAGCTQIHEETASGEKTARPVLEEIIRNLREETTLYLYLRYRKVDICLKF